MTAIKPEGICLFCGQSSTESTIYTHLKKHLEVLQATRQPVVCHIKVESGSYFLHLLLSNDCTFDKLDTYLKEIWLECCEHLSGFNEMRTANKVEMRSSEYYYQLLGIKAPEVNDDWGDEEYGIPFVVPFIKLFQKNKMFQYKYDFGSTTRSRITCLEKYAYPMPPKTRVLLLSRNEPLPIMCSTCKNKPAMYECWEHLDKNDGLYCEKCSEKHSKVCSEFEDGNRGIVCNSPRSGVCGYDGGTIDTERDGIYKISK